MNAFVTGTDTGAGKTYVTARLIRHLRARGRDTVGFKPICCGGREDAEILRAAADDVLSLNEVNPVWLRTPAAPYTAALIENRAIDLDLIRETLAALRTRHRSVLVEGVGGWLAPIRKDYPVADLAREIGFPVVVVVRNRLGALNHAVLTVERLRDGRRDLRRVDPQRRSARARTVARCPGDRHGDEPRGAGGLSGRADPGRNPRGPGRVEDRPVNR